MTSSTAARALALAAVALFGCSRPLARARTTHVEPVAPEEHDAGFRLTHARCSTWLGLLFPGLAQMCLHQDGKAAVVGGLAVGELGTAIAVAVETDEPGHPGLVLPVLALQNLWVYGLADAAIQKDLAERALYAPRDSLTDLVAAPFNWQVMKWPAVWAGTLGFLAVGIGVSLLISDVDTARAGDDPDLFGRRFDRRLGYPLGVGVGAGLFGHVAIGEEVLFRGYLQSKLARSYGERGGWIGASVIFGLAHAPNALALEGDQQRDYLLYALPIITAAGGYLGWLYRDSDYGLASPVAMHFWYDLLLTTTFFVIDPDSSPFQAGVTIPF
jgi:membrane protease YdiL (CAAX protease family)